MTEGGPSRLFPPIYSIGDPVFGYDEAQMAEGLMDISFTESLVAELAVRNGGW